MIKKQILQTYNQHNQKQNKKNLSKTKCNKLEIMMDECLTF